MADTQLEMATDEITAERQRQIDCEGWTESHDDEHKNGELEAAALCYIAHTSGFAPSAWPWGQAQWKPKTRRENLVRAGALRLAEYERLERLAAEAMQLVDIVIIKLAESEGGAQ